METLCEKLRKSNPRKYQQEETILDITEVICELLTATGKTRENLAKHLGKSKKYVNRFLDGRTKMGVRKLSDVFMFFGCKMTIGCASFTYTSESPVV